MVGTPLLRISCIRLEVRDLHRSTTFYRDLFAMQPRSEQHLTGKTAECIAGNGGSRPAFSIALSEGLHDQDGPQQLEHVAFEVATAAELLSLYQQAREMGARSIAPRVYGGALRTFIFDPDGHKLEIVAAEPPGTELLAAPAWRVGQR